ncbi:MAG: hypothetical protein K2X03_18560 [Bryobacteraceae bacterium]|nr:hypothetical protein [Bryobacteraceae bacterium]
MPSSHQERLRDAVCRIPVDPGLRVRVCATFVPREPTFRLARQLQLAGVIFALAFVAGSGSRGPRGPASVEEQLAEAGAFRLAVGDHLECALRRKRIGQPGLTPPAHPGSEHLCHYEGHALTHLTMAGNDGVASLIIARREADGPPIEGMRQARTSELTVTAIASHGFDVYLVSHQNPHAGQERMRQLMPRINRLTAMMALDTVAVARNPALKRTKPPKPLPSGV